MNCSYCRDRGFTATGSLCPECSRTRNYALVRPVTISVIGYADTELGAVEAASRHSRDFNYVVAVCDNATPRNLVATCHPGGKVERP